MKRDSEVADFLQRVPLFSKCSRKELASISKLAEILSYDADARIVAQGQPGTDFYVVLDGTATVHRDGQLVSELGPGGYFGELALLDPAPRNADVDARTPMTIARLGVGPFCSLLRSVPEINERLLAGLARRVRDADRQAVE